MEAAEPNTIQIIIYSVVGILLLILALLAILIPVNIQIIKLKLIKISEEQSYFQERILQILEQIRINTINYEDE